ncbi:transcriptional regulator, AraC family [Luteibacter sp. UNCMF331Sha3.1]|uniref:helix-turn-helix domain-containing protein n=1 Tax=Luteibacter sp. UNCMF331Sha3.1 TaxID=1502760 RepID=UPI0008C56788|nr:AraC family transcriptional regulator [Luteibacter sp. UNCMF331Sha3.1]SEN21966.1 transcriptional regulator, AraC family [Luteibacter sp. UNCMF331Sha3.1]
MPMFAGPDDLREAGRTERAYEKAIHPIVYRELAWREPIPSTRCDDRVVASRWTSPPRDDLHAITPGDSHVVAIFLRATRGTIRVDGQSLSDGVIPAGSVVVTAPGQAIHATFGEPIDCLHLRMVDAFVAEHGPIDAAPLTGVYRDDAIEKLARALLAAHDTGCRVLSAESLGRPIASRLFHLRMSGAQRMHATPRITIQGWRLARVTDYVGANLDKPITLADIARAAGLSPMHFAAQFRAATGHKPHEYLQLRRIERAKELLDRGHLSLIEIALETGFRTQAHFTTVFKRFAGSTPHSWRERERH